MEEPLPATLTPDASGRRRHFTAVRDVLLVTLSLNLLVTSIKLTAGYLTGSLSLVAGGFDSLFDTASNAVGLVGVYIASRPPDASHPYGHRKFETLTAVAIAALLISTGFQLLRSAIGRLSHPGVVPQVTVWSFMALIFSMIVQLAVSRYEARRGRELQSDLLLADALHTRGDFWVSLSVVGGLIAVRLGLVIMDPLLALAIAGVIAKIGIDIIRDTSKVLADAVAIAPDRVRDITLSVDGVLGVHAIRSRGPANDVWIDMHIQVNPQLGIERAHAIGHAVKSHILAEIPGVQDVVVHIEPESSLDAETDVVAAIRRVVGQFPVTPHEIQVYDAHGVRHASLHLELDEAMTLATAHNLATRVEDAVMTQVPGIDVVTTHLEPLPAQVARSESLAHYTPFIQDAIDEAAAGIEGLWDCHDVSVRDVNGRLFLTVHCLCHGDMSIGKAHRLSSRLERELKARLPQIEHIIIHVEPPEAR